MKILVTTPTGKVGRELVSQLEAKKLPFRLATRNPDALRQLHPSAELVRYDHTDPASAKAALAGISAVYLASPGDFPAAPEQSFVDAARKAGVSRLVKLSVMGIENTDSPIRQVERHIEASGVPWTFLRPTWFMQNFSTSHADAIRKGQWAEPAGQGQTAFIDTRDIAAVALEALVGEGHAGKAYTLTGPELLDRPAVAAIFTKELGRRIEFTDVTDAQFRAAVGPYLTPSYLELLSSLYGFVRAGYTAQLGDGVQKALGRAPTSFAAFVRDHRGVWG
jgi:uncharacterized protein YbjT (DUF2867 family)